MLKPIALVCVWPPIPIWLPQKLYCLYSLLTIAARLFLLLPIIHSIQTIIKENAAPSWISMYWIKPTNVAANDFISEWEVLDPVFILRSVLSFHCPALVCQFFAFLLSQMQLKTLQSLTRVQKPGIAIFAFTLHRSKNCKTIQTILLGTTFVQCHKC